MLRARVVRGAFGDLRLRLQRSERRTKLMRGVSGESPFVLDQACYPLKHCVKAAHERHDFSRRAFRHKWTEVVRLTLFDFLYDAIDRQDSTTDADPDEKPEDWQRED